MWAASDPISNRFGFGSGNLMGTPRPRLHSSRRMERTYSGCHSSWVSSSHHPPLVPLGLIGWGFRTYVPAGDRVGDYLQ